MSFYDAKSLKWKVQSKSRTLCENFDLCEDRRKGIVKVFFLYACFLYFSSKTKEINKSNSHELGERRNFTRKKKKTKHKICIQSVVKESPQNDMGSPHQRGNLASCQRCD